MSGGTGNADGSDPIGQMGARDANSAFNQHQFQQRQVFGEKRFHFTGEIIAVHNRNSLTEPCTVDVKPHVRQMDEAGQTTSHGIIYGIAVPRSQSGGSVFVNDPQVGDPANFSVLDRDHSSVQANDWVESNPGSYRRHSMSDAIFHGVLPRKSQPVTQHIMLSDTGIDIADVNKNTLRSSASGWTINGVVIDQKGNFTAPGNVTAGKGSADQVDLQGHSHSGNGAAPTAGS